MKLCLLATLSTAYENMPADLVERKMAEAELAAAILRRATGDDVVLLDPVGSLEQGVEAGHRLWEDPYAVVIVPTIATMAAFPWAAVESLDVPIVVWTCAARDPYPRDAGEMVFESGPVGATAIGNVLARHGRTFRSTIGPDVGARALALLRAARSLPGFAAPCSRTSAARSGRGCWT